MHVSRSAMSLPRGRTIDSESLIDGGTINDG